MEAKGSLPAPDLGALTWRSRRSSDTLVVASPPSCLLFRRKEGKRCWRSSTPAPPAGLAPSGSGGGLDRPGPPGPGRRSRLSLGSSAGARRGHCLLEQRPRAFGVCWARELRTRPAASSSRPGANGFKAASEVAEAVAHRSAPAGLPAVPARLPRFQIWDDLTPGKTANLRHSLYGIRDRRPRSPRPADEAECADLLSLAPPRPSCWRDFRRGPGSG